MLELNIWTNLFILFVVYQSRMYLSLIFSKKNREGHKKTRERLKELRNIAIKTREEQIEFINLKEPKKDRFKWSFMNVIKKLPIIIIMISIYIGIRYLWKNYIPFLFTWWQVLLVFILLPIIINIILKKYNMHQDDIRVYFGGGRK